MEVWFELDVLFRIIASQHIFPGHVAVAFFPAVFVLVCPVLFFDPVGVVDRSEAVDTPLFLQESFEDEMVR